MEAAFGLKASVSPRMQRPILLPVHDTDARCERANLKEHSDEFEDQHGVGETLRGDFWISGTLAFLLFSLGKWYSVSGAADQGYSASDTFLLGGLMSFAVMANGGHGAIRHLKKEIADLKSGDADVSAATQDSEWDAAERRLTYKAKVKMPVVQARDFNGSMCAGYDQ